MAGFDNQPPASEYRKYTSYGRTRQPKNVAGAHGTQATVGKVGGNTTDAPTAATDGHSTENQRFLHLFVKHSAGVNKTVQVYGYNYAFGEWAPLFISLGNATMTQVICGTGTTGGQGQLHIIDVSGVDRVGFFSAASDAPDQSTRAAFTTF